MNKPNRCTAGPAAQPSKHKLSRDTVFLVGDLLPLFDFAGVLLAALLGTLIYASSVSPGWNPAGILGDGGRAALAAAVLAPFILCDRAFVSFASGGQTAAMVRCYAVRFLMFAGVVACIGLASRSLHSLPGAWLVLWLASTLLVTAVMRLLLVGTLRRLERKGILAETIAVVGAGPVADRLIRQLQQTRGNRVDIVGVFDDGAGCSEGCTNEPIGSIADLIDLGRTRTLDWIVLALPATADGRSDQLTQGIVHRLKALAVPIGLCAQNDSVAPPCPVVRSAGEELALNPGDDQPIAGRHSTLAVLPAVLPRWILTLIGLPLLGFRLLAIALREIRTPRVLPPKLPFALDNHDLASFTGIAARFGDKQFGYVVTPNADHLIRFHREPSFRALYADAAYVLLDSRFISKLLRFTRKLDLPVCTGSDLTARLFDKVIAPGDRLVLIGGSAEQAARLSERYGLKQLAHFNPPMGFIDNPEAVETCLRFIEAHSPFRFCLLAIGAPRQEMIAQRLKARGVARGMALCIGASINFLTGEEQRAPMWMQRSGMEWLFRLLQAPGRMAGRYLVRGPQVFGLLRHTEVLQRSAETHLKALPDSPRSPAPALAMPRRRAAAHAGIKVPRHSVRRRFPGVRQSDSTILPAPERVKAMAAASMPPPKTLSRYTLHA